MARPLRIEYPGALYHVTSRGNDRSKIFRSGKDRSGFLAVLQHVVQQFKWVLHGYCLMDNHYHLVVETPEANLSRGMRQLNGMYTQKFNWRHHTTGHVFQGRYKAVLVDKDSYLLELSRYVVLNPVRAGMVEGPEDWPWSNYRATAGITVAPVFLTTDWLLAQFGRRVKQAQRRFRAFVLKGIAAESPWTGLKAQILLGDAAFVERFKPLLKEKDQVTDIPRAQRLLDRPALSALFANAETRDLRDRLVHEAHVTHRYTLAEIGRHLDLHYATVSKIVSRVGEAKR